MSHRRVFASVAAGLVLGLGARAADAGPVTWEFAGVITFVSDPDNDLRGAIPVGTPFSGSFTFESATPDSSPESPSGGVYDDPITAVSGQVGGFAFLGPDPLVSLIWVTDSSHGDNDILSVSAGSVSFPDFDMVSSFKFLLSNPDGSMFTSDALPLVPPDLAMFPGSSVSFNFAQSSAFVSGEVSVLVPEPGSLALLAFGMLTLVRKRRFSRSLGALAILFVSTLGVPSDLHAQWSQDYGPVIIGGDDMEEHRTGDTNIPPPRRRMFDSPCGMVRAKA